MALEWKFHHPDVTLDMLGLIPLWLNENDPRGLVEQMDSGYGMGGFKYPITGFKEVREKCLKYPGDPVLKPLASLKLRDETLVFYDCAICAVFQKDGSFVAAKFD
jgi:hypothetical protein